MIGHGGKGGERDEDGASTDATGAERFADLIGTTRPIAKGPKRVEPAAARPRSPTQRKQGKQTHAFRWPDPEDRHRAAISGVNDAQLRGLARGELEPEERIDLHGTRRETAGHLLARRLESAAGRGLRCVAVIHGRGRRSEGGEAILRDALPDWLTGPSCASRVAAFAPAPRRLGGDGVTLVLLRRARS